jgi:probable addiction module antidote protein
VISNRQSELRQIGELKMAEQFTKWDVVNYWDSVRDAGGYLEACWEEAPDDIDFLRLALSDVARAHGMGKFELGIGNSDEELLKALVDTGHLSHATALEIARALGMQLRTTA